MKNSIFVALAASLAVFAVACSQQPVEVVAGGEPPESTAEVETTDTTQASESAESSSTSGLTVPGTAPASQTERPDSINEPDPYDLPYPEIPSESEEPDLEDHWRSHSLAGLVVTPARLGDDWSYDYVDVLKFEQADADNLVCSVAAPDQLAGLDVELSRPEQEFVQIVGQGTEAQAQAWIDALTALGACDGTAASDSLDATLLSAEVSGADSSFALEIVTNEDPYGFTRLVGARYGTVFVIVGSAAESDKAAHSLDALQDHLEWSGAQIER